MVTGLTRKERTVVFALIFTGIPCTILTNFDLNSWLNTLGWLLYFSGISLQVEILFNQAKLDLPELQVKWATIKAAVAGLVAAMASAGLIYFLPMVTGSPPSWLIYAPKLVTAITTVVLAACIVYFSVGLRLLHVKPSAPTH